MVRHKYNRRTVDRCKIFLRWLVAGALYYTGTLYLYRIFWAQKPIVLNYHRVCNPHCEEENVPAGMYVRSETFEKHVRYLTREYQVVTMDQLVRMHQHGSLNHGRYCVITFDDGWKDNYNVALPLLRKYGLSATIFASTSL